MTMPKITKLEPITAAQIKMIANQLGMGAIIARIADADPKKGAGTIDKNTKCLWTRDRKRITISHEHGTTIASCSTETDPDAP